MRRRQARVDGHSTYVDAVDYIELEGRGAGYYALSAVLVALVAAGLWAAHYMDSEGHHVTSMTNQIVWGAPHVFAVFLIVASSGALNVATMASVFDRAAYKPLARLSGLLAIALLLGGLAVLVLDLGRPDRLNVAMTHYNFKSVFAWNVFLYTGFLLVVLAYLWVSMERRLNRHAGSIGLLALIWRVVLTTGTGCIFGFLVARQAYDAAMMAPLFVLMSFSFGLAVFMLAVISISAWARLELGMSLLLRLKGLLGVFVSLVLYLTVVFHLANLYATEHHGFERFLLLEGGRYTVIFWVGQIVLGSLVPLTLFYWSPTARSRSWIGLGAALVVVGGLAQVYVIIIAGQAYPLSIFPGSEIVESSFFDGTIALYWPSLPEVALGVGGVAFALLVVVLAMRVLKFLPVSLADGPGRETR